MKKLADDIYVLEGFPPYAINVYLVGDVLVDSGTRHDAGRILRKLTGRTIKLHTLTHAHPDHQGSSHAICETLGIPLWCGEADSDAMEKAGEIMARMPRHWLSGSIGPLWLGPPHPIARRLREGDQVGTFTVIDTPGHTVGHVSYWREGDRTLIVGDVVANLHIYSGLPMLREPERFFSLDPALNRQSLRKIAALEPKLVCFGHGPPLRNPSKLLKFAISRP